MLLCWIIMLLCWIIMLFVMLDQIFHITKQIIIPSRIIYFQLIYLIAYTFKITSFFKIIQSSARPFIFVIQNYRSPAWYTHFPSLSLAPLHSDKPDISQARHKTNAFLKLSSGPLSPKKKTNRNEKNKSWGWHGKFLRLSPPNSLSLKILSRNSHFFFGL